MSRSIKGRLASLVLITVDISVFTFVCMVVGAVITLDFDVSFNWFEWGYEARAVWLLWLCVIIPLSWRYHSSS